MCWKTRDPWETFPGIKGIGRCYFLPPPPNLDTQTPVGTSVCCQHSIYNLLAGHPTLILGTWSFKPGLGSRSSPTAYPCKPCKYHTQSTLHSFIHLPLQPGWHQSPAAVGPLLQHISVESVGTVCPVPIFSCRPSSSNTLLDGAHP